MWWRVANTSTCIYMSYMYMYYAYILSFITYKRMRTCVCVCVCMCVYMHNDPRQTCKHCAITHSYVCHDAVFRVTSFAWHMWIYMCAWLIPMYTVTSLYVTHVPWLVHAYVVTQSHGSHSCDACRWICVHDSFRCVLWLMYTCAMTHSYAHCDVFICVTLAEFIIARSSFVCVPWPIYVCVL